MKKLLLLFAFLPLSAFAQGPTALQGTGGTCTAAPCQIAVGTNLTLSSGTLSASGGTTTTFNNVTSGTNTNTLAVGTGGSLAASGTGTIAATSLTTLAGLPAQLPGTVLSNCTSSSAAPAANTVACIYPVNATETAASITASQLNLSYPFLDARRYKIDMTGATDSTTAMTLAHSMGLVVNYPSGKVKFSTVSMPWGGIHGAGSSETVFNSTDLTTANLITVTVTGFPPNSVEYLTATGVKFEGFSIYTSAGTKTAGYVIYASSSNPFAGQGSRFTDIVFYNMASGVYLNDFTTPAFVSDIFGLSPASSGTGISYGTPDAANSCA